MNNLWLKLGIIFISNLISIGIKVGNLNDDHNVNQELFISNAKLIDFGYNLKKINISKDSINIFWYKPISK